MGAVGRRVARELYDTAQTLDPTASLAVCPLADGRRGPVELRRRLEARLSTLLEAGQVQGADDGRARLDLCVICDASDDPELTALTAALDVVVDVLVEGFGVLFPVSSPPHSRSVWLSVCLATPALTATEVGIAALEGLRRLEAWADAAKHPALSRIFVLPRQTTAGRLSDEAVEASLRLFVQAVYLSGVRDRDEIRALVGHRPDDRRLASISVAAAELPVARLRRYARWRAAWDGFSTLVELAEHPSTDPARARGLLARLDVDALVEPFREGDAAQRVRKHAAALSGATDRLPTRFKVRLAERSDAVRGRFRVLFDPAAQPAPEWGTRSPDHADLLRLLDQVEADALDTAAQRLGNLLTQELDPTTALEVLPDLESALGRAQHDLEQGLARAVPEEPRVDPPPSPRDEGLIALRRALAGRPQPERLIPVAVAVAIVVGVTAGIAVLALQGGGPPPIPPPTTGIVPTSAADAPPWVAMAVGGGAGLVAFVTWILFWLHQGRRRLESQLRARSQELEELWRRGGAGQPGRQAVAVLTVRSRRTLAGLVKLLTGAQERIAAMRAALRQARGGARRELDLLRVRVADAQGSDDLTDLLGEESPLHRPLLPPGLLAQRIADARDNRDRNRWAQVLLEATWPAGGIATDLPGLDADAIAAVCDGQHRGLGGDLLAGPDVRPIAEDRLARFLSGARGALAHGVRPQDRHGDPAAGDGKPEVFLVAPVDFRTASEAALGRDAVPSVWGNAATPWAVMLSVHGRFRTEEIARGMGVDP